MLKVRILDYDLDCSPELNIPSLDELKSRCEFEIEDFQISVTENYSTGATGIKYPFITEDCFDDKFEVPWYPKKITKLVLTLDTDIDTDILIGNEQLSGYKPKGCVILNSNNRLIIFHYCLTEEVKVTDRVMITIQFDSFSDVICKN